MRFRAVLLLAAAGILAAQTPREWLNRGVQAFKSAHYPEAVAAFQQAVNADPASATARLYLATAYMQQFIPGAQTPENLAFAQNAQREFQQVIDMDPSNKVALSSVASLALNTKNYNEARQWYRRLLSVDPDNREAWYSLAFTAWTEWYPAYMKVRAQLGMRPETPGPLPDATERAALRNAWMPILDEGIWNLNRALAIDPAYDDAMAYMNLLVRERADLRDTREEYARDIAEADQWVEKALAVKKNKGMQAWASARPPVAPTPPPPGGNSAGLKLLSKPEPVYPPAARRAGIQGNVVLSVTVGADGRVKDIQVMSGHPLLVPAALDAVKQYIFEPFVLNGEPVSVQTPLSVLFALQ